MFVFLVGYVNYRGVRITGRVQDFLTYTMLGFLLTVSLYALSACPVDMGAALSSPRFTLENVFMAAAVGVFMYVGFEWVTPIAEETEDYRMVGRGMMIAVGLLSVTYALFVVAMYAGLTEAQLRSGTVIPHILFARNLFGPVGAAMFIVMSILASVTSFNAGLLNTSRFSYAMARDNVLPRWFAKLHPEYATPWTSILALMVFAAVLSLAIAVSGQYLFIIVMAAALECFIYVVMAVCVIRLRKKHPDRERAYCIPFGKTLPVITAVAFFLLMVGLFADTTRDYAGNVVFHNGWVALAMAIFGGICVAYTLVVVPRLKQAAAARAATRKRRRPPRKPAS